jgi:hypothetical protein
VAAVGGFVRTPGGVCGKTGLVPLGGGEEEAVAAALADGVTTGDGRVTRGGATGLGAGLYRGMGFATASVGLGELGRGAGVFIGVGRMRRGVVCETRSGIEEVVGTAGVIRGVTMGSADSAGETDSEGEG